MDHPTKSFYDNHMHDYGAIHVPLEIDVGFDAECASIMRRS